MMGGGSGAVTLKAWAAAVFGTIDIAIYPNWVSDSWPIRFQDSK
jgi:hypothetical protein